MARQWQQLSLEGAKRHPLYGIKNWLAVFAFGILIAPLRSIGGVSNAAREAGLTLSQLLNADISTGAFVTASMAFDSAVAGLLLWLLFSKNRHFRVASISLLVLQWPAYFVVAFITGGTKIPGFVGVFVFQFFGGLLLTVIWVAYLQRSRRVRVTFENCVVVEKKSTSQIRGNGMPVPTTQASSSGNDAYAAALAEIEEGSLDKGVWARAFAEAGGDEPKAKALYIKARAESLKAAGVGSGWVPPATKSIGLYEAAIGEKSQAYYVAVFDRLDQGAYGINPSWNWAAFLFAGYWALYRKLYGWFFACIAVVATAGLLYRSHGSEAAALILFSVAWVAFAVFANSIYHLNVKAKISAAQKSISEPAKLVEYLSANGGVHAWVLPIVGSIPLIGIVLALALPAYNDYTKRRVTGTIPVQAPTTQADWEKGVITPPPSNPFSETQAQDANAKQAAQPSQIEEFLNAAPNAPSARQAATPSLVPFNGKLDDAPREARSASAQSDNDKAMKEHFRLVYAAHPDIEAVLESAGFRAWLAKYPAYERIVVKGTAPEVIGMLNTYKKQNQLPGAAAQSPNAFYKCNGPSGVLYQATPCGTASN